MPRSQFRSARAYARGMTLIEILVVLVLIGVVLGIVGVDFLGRGEKAKADAAKIEIGQIGQALDLYKLETGRYPTTQEGLQALISAPTSTLPPLDPARVAARAGSEGRLTEAARRPPSIGVDSHRLPNGCGSGFRRGSVAPLEHRPQLAHDCSNAAFRDRSPR